MPAKSKSVKSQFLYVGIKGRVLALNKSDGSIAWSTELSRGSTFVSIVQEGDRLYAASGGEVTCLDGISGEVLWNNQLPGLGIGYVALAGGGFPTAAVALEDEARAEAAS